jgi:hypothetical protein
MKEKDYLKKLPFAESSDSSTFGSIFTSSPTSHFQTVLLMVFKSKNIKHILKKRTKKLIQNKEQLAVRINESKRPSSSSWL